MSERSDLLESISSIIVDYRSGELPKPDPVHVERWIEQFGDDVQLPILREMDHVLGKTYFSQADVEVFLSKLFISEKIAGKDPRSFWAGVNFLDIQKDGQSQSRILLLADRILNGTWQLTMQECGGDSGTYIYIDDVLFSGSRAGNDLSRWITEDAPPSADVHIVVTAAHTLGEYLLRRRLQEVSEESGKVVRIEIWRFITVENRKAYSKDSGVLWPSSVPDDDHVRRYLAEERKFPFEPRQEGGSHEFFSSEHGRQLLEREFLIAGVKILNRCATHKSVIRPLGFSHFGVGFGSTIVTYQNCPNNCPLALWWGEPSATSGHLHWYPLVQRRTYDHTVEVARDPEF
jgi:hypothetical protein